MRIDGLYFITDPSLTKQGVFKDTEQVLEAGCRIVQYREKQKPLDEKIAEAKELLALCKKHNALFIVNNDVEIAKEVGAGGVHLGQDDMPIAEARKILGNKVIGLTAHNVAEAVEAEKSGAQYLGISPIFHTDTKKDAGEPAGVKLLRDVKEKVGIPLVGIGGINGQNLEQVFEAGADSVAIISAIVCAENVFDAAEKIVQKIEGLK